MSDSYKVRLMGFEEGKKRREQSSIACPGPKVAGIQAGKLKEPLRAPFVGERRCESRQRQRFGIAGVVVCPVA